MTNNLEYYPLSGATITAGSFEDLFSGEGSVTIARSQFVPALPFQLSEAADIDFSDIYKITFTATNINVNNCGYYDTSDNWVSISSSKITYTNSTVTITNPQLPANTAWVFLGCQRSPATFSNFAIYDSNNNNITLAAEKPEDTGFSTASMLGAYVGSEEVTKIYLGTEVVYENSTPTPTPTGGIHLTSDGLGIVFPAGTYTNKDGNPDFQEYSESGRTSSDSITFTEDAVFPYHYQTEDYTTIITRDWYETNATSLPAVSSNYNATISYTPDVAGRFELTSFSGTTAKVKKVSNASWSGYEGFGNGTFTITNFSDGFINSTNGELMLPTQIRCGYRSSTSASYSTNQSFFGGTNYIRKIDGTTGNSITINYNNTAGANSSTGYTFRPNSWYETIDGVNTSTQSSNIPTTFTLNSNDTILIHVKASTGGASSVVGSAVGELLLADWTKDVINPKVVKLGLGGYSYSGEGHLEQNTVLGEDTRNGWDLGYVKFSDSEPDKLVQYSKTPIT